MDTIFDSENFSRCSLPFPSSVESGPSVSAESSEAGNLVGAALENLGNTCFLNAVLQSLMHTVPLLERLLSIHHASEYHIGGFCALCALRDQVELSLASSGGTLSPDKLVENLNQFSSSFERYQQEDAHEFLQCFLNKLEDCLLDLEKHNLQIGNLVKQVFGGRLVSRLRRCNCNHYSDTVEPFHDLSLEIEDADTLQSALESFTRVEKIESEDMNVTCENCKENVSVEKQIMLDKTPSIAVLHLKRFKNTGFFVEKVDKFVNYPLELDLQPYTLDSKKNDAELKYDLYAIVVHSGVSSTSGHYLCYIRCSLDTWYCFDDSKVTRVSEATALSQEAYVLFYARQGTPFFSTFRGIQKKCCELSPQSVLDNGEVGISKPFSSPSDDDDLKVTVHIRNPEKPSRPCDFNKSNFNEVRRDPDANTSVGSSSPFIYSERPQQPEKAMEEQMKEALKLMRKCMQSSRRSQLMAVMKGCQTAGPSNRKRNRSVGPRDYSASEKSPKVQAGSR